MVDFTVILAAVAVVASAVLWWHVLTTASPKPRRVKASKRQQPSTAAPGDTSPPVGAPSKSTAGPPLLFFAPSVTASTTNPEAVRITKGRRGPRSLGTDVVFLVRHGERIDYVQKKWAATAAHPEDPPLSPHGIVQGATVGAYWQKRMAKASRMGRGPGAYDATVIVTSPMLRCRQTAEELRRSMRCPCFVHPALSDWIAAKFYRKAPALDADSGPQFPTWPFPTSGVAGPLPPYPETSKALEHRMAAVCRDVTAQLRQAVTTHVGVDLTSARPVTAADFAKAATMAPAVATPTVAASLRVVFVTHGDCIDRGVAALCPRSTCARTGDGINVPYCSVTELAREHSALSVTPQRHGTQPKGQQREQVQERSVSEAEAATVSPWWNSRYGDVGPVGDAVVKLHFAR